MTLLLLVILAATDVVTSLESGCVGCSQQGPWWPLFKPSQILHSDFPEHVRHKSSKHSQYNSLEKSDSQAISLGPQDLGGIDSRVKSYNSNGRHQVEWDHFGDVVTVTQGGSDRSSSESGALRVTVGNRAPPNSLEVGRGSEEVKVETPNQRNENVLQEEDVSTTSQESSFFSDGSFFNKKLASPTDNFPEDFEISKEAISNEEHQPSNSIEHFNSDESNSRRPVATSYSAISSIFAGKNPPIPTQPRDLLHPDLTYNDVYKYITNQVNIPVSRSQFFNGRNVTKQYLVHEDRPESSGVLRVSHGAPSGRSNRPSFLRFDQRYKPFVPQSPVYRYTKEHHGFPYQYHREPTTRSSNVVPGVQPQLHNKFLFNNLHPYVRVQNHHTLVQHDVPTKKSFIDNVWKDSKKNEDSKPLHLGPALYFFKKKPNEIHLKKITRRQGNNHVYIVKSNRRLS